MIHPDGRFYFEEDGSHALARPGHRRLLNHPTHDRFIVEPERRRLRVGRHRADVGRGDAIIGVGERLP